MLKNYLKTAWAVFQRRKFFTFVNLFGIVFTLAVLLVAVALMDNIFGKLPPEVNADRTLTIFHTYQHGEYEDGGGTTTQMPPSYYLLDQTIHDLNGVQEVSINSVITKVISYATSGERIESWLKYTDAAYWRILQFKFVEGRPFTQDEYDNLAYVAVINEATKNRFFGDKPAVGKMIELDGRRFRVVGVVRNVSFLRLIPFADVWAPIPTSPAFDPHDRSLGGTFMGMLMADNSRQLPAIRQEYIDRINSFDLTEFKPITVLVATPETFFEFFSRAVFMTSTSTENNLPQLYMMMFLLVLLFMLLPIINLVNLNVSRILERASEIGVRKAFGAPGLTLIGQFIFENILLTLFGAILALGFAWAILAFISDLGLIPYAHFVLSGRVFAVGLLLTLLFGLLSGLYPAFRMSRMNPIDALQRREQ